MLFLGCRGAINCGFLLFVGVLKPNSHEKWGISVCLGLPSGLFPSDYPTKILYDSPFSPKCAISPTHLILALLALIIFSGAYKSCSPQYAVFISILVLTTVFGPNVFLSTLHVNTLAYIQILHLHKIKDKILIFVFFRQHIGRRLRQIVWNMEFNLLWIFSWIQFCCSKIF
jgi:hypothetical protein